jgi:hypothetical protein
VSVSERDRVRAIVVAEVHILAAAGGVADIHLGLHTVGWGIVGGAARIGHVITPLREHLYVALLRMLWVNAPPARRRARAAVGAEVAGVCAEERGAMVAIDARQDPMFYLH